MCFWVYSWSSVSSSASSSVSGSDSVFSSSSASVGFGVVVNSVFDLIMKIMLMIESAPVGIVASSMPSV